MFSIDDLIFISLMVSISYLFDSVKSFMILYFSEYLPVLVFQSEILFKIGNSLFLERLRIKVAHYKTTEKPRDYLYFYLFLYKDLFPNCLRYL